MIQKLRMLKTVLQKKMPNKGEQVLGATLTVQDFFKLVLFLLGIGALTYLILVLKNLNKILLKVNNFFESNEKNINTVVKQLPEISENINSITKTANATIEEITPEMTELISNVNEITTKIDSITESVDNTTYKISETMDIVTDTVADTAYSLQDNIKNIDTYIKLILEVIDAIKGYLKKK